MDILGKGLKYLVIALMGGYLIYCVLLFGWLAIALIIDFFRSPKESLKGLFKIIVITIGVILIGVFLNLLNPVWNGIDNGFEEVWNNIKDSWLVFIVKNILIYLLMLFFLLIQIFVPILIGCLLATIPATIINFLMKLIAKRDEILLLPDYPRDTLEIIYLLLTITCCSILAIWIFMKYFMETVVSFNYGPY